LSISELIRPRKTWSKAWKAQHPEPQANGIWPAITYRGGNVTQGSRV
jgi:hypothetical protein